MDALDAIFTRRSIRKFIGKKIPEDVVTKILQAGVSSPSAGNRQPWRFIVVSDREKISRFDPADHQPWVECAPAVIVVCANPHDTWGKYSEDEHYYWLDASAAIQNMLLAIHAQGLGGVWVISCGKKVIREILNIPSHWVIVSIIPFGYFDSEDSVKFEGKTYYNKTFRPKKTVGEVSFVNNFQTGYG